METSCGTQSLTGWARFNDLVQLVQDCPLTLTRAALLCVFGKVTQPVKKGRHSQTQTVVWTEIHAEAALCLD